MEAAGHGMKDLPLLVNLDRLDPGSMARDDPNVALSHVKVGRDDRHHAIVCGAVDGPFLHENRQQLVGPLLDQGALAAPGLHVDAIPGHTETLSPDARRAAL